MKDRGIRKIQSNPVLNEKVNMFLNNPESLTQLVLDSSVLFDHGAVSSDVLDLLELHIQENISTKFIRDESPNRYHRSSLHVYINHKL